MTFSQLIIASLCVVLSVENSTASDWMRYENARFGTIADVPLYGFSPLPPPSNGDGQRWLSMDGKSEIGVYGSYVSSIGTWDEYKAFRLNALESDGADVTYSAEGPDWFVYSGVADHEIFYIKVLISTDCGVEIANHLYATYPEDQKAAFDPIITRMSKSLAPGDCSD